MNKRSRKEWTTEENNIFSNAIKNNMPFKEIKKLIPTRSSCQIRTHYKYFEKELNKNEIKSRKRRIGKRGRPLNLSKYSGATDSAVSNILETITERNGNKIHMSNDLKTNNNKNLCIDFKLDNNFILPRPNVIHVPILMSTQMPIHIVDYNLNIQTSLILDS
jgi:hypothetical protein